VHETTRPGESASALIDEMIAELTDWRGKTLASIRKSILDATRRSLRNGSGWEAGVVSRRNHCGRNAHKDKVKLTFAHGASLPDPENFSTPALEHQWRAIDLFEAIR